MNAPHASNQRIRRRTIAGMVLGSLVVSGTAILIFKQGIAPIPDDSSPAVTQGCHTVSRDQAQKNAAPSPHCGSPASESAARPPSGPVVNGKDISSSNTGYRSWIGANGQRCTDAALKVYSSKVTASQLGNATCVWLRAGLTADTAITLTAARIDARVESTGARLTLNWSTVDATDADYAIGGHVSAYRSQLINGNDGVRFYGTSIVESYIRVRQESPDDHNDGVQAYRAVEGGEILRSNIDSRPVNMPGALGNAAIFIADNSRGELTIRDNWLAGGEYTLRLHDAATYQVTGNIVTGYETWPVSTDKSIPHAFLQWRNNVTGNGTKIELRQ